ncbi:hypothetical protein LXL04_027936 [Taraxacum kok-saghyz]
MAQYQISVIDHSFDLDLSLTMEYSHQDTITTATASIFKTHERPSSDEAQNHVSVMPSVVSPTDGSLCITLAHFAGVKLPATEKVFPKGNLLDLME